ncbi:hypothetical protein ACGFIF_27905 [Kribbella sp. NPDC049174]|uniref:hypothetical protein n=1 Tax=Kribbella sp. NPDC049174 TaxID=3364112 RepID=UPI003723E16E
MTAEAFVEGPRAEDRVRGVDARPPRHEVELRIIAQDPSVKGPDGRIVTANAKVPAARLENGPRSARFSVVDYDVSTATLVAAATLPSGRDRFAEASDETLCTDLAFHAQQVYAVAARTLATFEFALGRRLPWGFAGHQLYLVPHAFSEANAYYSFEDRALLFGYVPGGGDADIYTCLSHDVVVHETTHAVLDGLRRRFLEPGLADQAGFHEGFADIAALLSVFSLEKVVEVCLDRESIGSLRREQIDPDALRNSVLTGVAEQLGDVLTQGRGALRQSALRKPPTDWRERPEYREPHRRGEVLVAVVLEVLIDIWTRRMAAYLSPGDGRAERTVDRARAAEEGAKAAKHLLTMLIRGLDYLPPVEFEFGDLLDAVILADEEVVPEDKLNYRAGLLTQFEEFGIVRPAGTTRDLLSGDFAARYNNMNFTALRTAGDEVFRFIWENADVLDIETDHYTYVESVLPSERVGPDGLVVRESVANYVQMLQLTAAELATRSGHELPAGLDLATKLQLFGGGTLVFDQFGRAKFHIFKRLGDWNRQVERVKYLHDGGYYDRFGRLGFSYQGAAGQLFAELHSAVPDAGESW